jgi:hypothetical protein
MFLGGAKNGPYLDATLAGSPWLQHWHTADRGFNSAYRKSNGNVSLDIFFIHFIHHYRIIMYPL